jgi:hypothetical protein
MPPPPDMGYWLSQKYAIGAKQAEGSYQRDIAEAGLRTAQAGTETRIQKFFDDPARLDAVHDILTRRGTLPIMGGEAPPAQQAPPPTPGPGALDYFKNWFGSTPPAAPTAPTAPAATTTPAAPSPIGTIAPSTQLPTTDPLNRGSLTARRSLVQSPLTSLLRPSNPSPLTSPNYSPLRPGTQNLLNAPLGTDQQGFRKGSANVKAPPGKGGRAGKAGGAGGMPKGLEALLPMLLAAQQGQGGQGAGPPPAPGGLPGGPPAGPPPAPGGAGLKRGSANVMSKGGKGAKAGKAAGGGGAGGGGLEAILPTLMAASQAGQMGGGAIGPQATTPAGPPSMAPGAAAPPGFAKGVVNVRRYVDGTSDVSIGDAMPSGFANGAPDVQPNPGYPFGAGYLFGATAVPGQGSGTVDTVPAVLAPHEAVLNKAAADMMGRGRIAALNARGAKQMGLRRGMANVF